MENNARAQELCESRGGRPGLPAPKSPYGLGGRTVALHELTFQLKFDRNVPTVPPARSLGPNRCFRPNADSFVWL